VHEVAQNIAAHPLDPIIIQGYIYDITDRRAAEGALTRAKTELTASLDQLQSLFSGIVEALASTVELRDPYTSGHEKRVTLLACALAREIHFDENRIAGLRIAGLLHDIGKLMVPAEILNKPTILSETEYDFIRIHPQAGHDILRKIAFPWPVADIVLQHHERLDGSGYPQGLKAPEIILEARILAVADVMEAMVSHRPYRPAKNLDRALKEIREEKAGLFDQRVVKSCAGLFEEKQFRFD
ncbi:MAG TPA: HD-GYP domain-containing protein, partial [bacterium]|nr:HD-GYP domain-containing protein [bacterium]